MRRLSLILIIPLAGVLYFLLPADSPHGKDFKMSCNTCHNADSWKFDKFNATFNHSNTAFPLSGQHGALDCRACHTSLVFTGAKTACASCHTDIHEQTVGDDCARCHKTASWLVTNVSGLHRQGRFPLVGAHAVADCQQCHQSASLQRYDPLGVDCFDCHQADFNATTSPNHSLAGFSTACYNCHKVNSFEWGGSGFTHSFFPLTQGHAINECARCHKSPDYSDISPECISCHQQDYNTTAEPNHLLAGFGTNCAECHTTNPGWAPANFDHSFFPLTEGHNIDQCSKCHTSGPYSSTSPDCYSCHADDYNTVTNPNHVAGNYPKDCKLCHTSMSTWSGATFNHPWFPIYSGNHHQGVWNTCGDCHTNPSDYTVFTCLDCHNNPGELANEHDEEPGYQYNSNACLLCHPTGNADK
jgi:hypothetical protein